MIRLLADSTWEPELLAPKWLSQPHAAERDDKIIVTWTAHDACVCTSSIAGVIPQVPSYRSPGPGTARSATTLLHGDGAVMLAVGEHGRWSVAPLAQDRTPSPPRRHSRLFWPFLRLLLDVKHAIKQVDRLLSNPGIDMEGMTQLCDRAALPLNDREREFVDRIAFGELCPGLLTDEAELQAVIQDHSRLRMLVARRVGGQSL